MISITALIPFFIGVPLIILGVLAFDEKKIKYSMHSASVLVTSWFNWKCLPISPQSDFGKYR